MSKSTTLFTLLAVAILSSVFLTACIPGRSTTSPSPTPEQLMQAPASSSPVAMASPAGSTAPVTGGPSAEQIQQAGIVFDTGAPEWQVNGEKYQKQLKYQTPGGPEDVKFEVSVNNGAISAVEVTTMGKSPITKEMQANFKANISKAIVGKKVAELGTIDRVGGASLTTRAFNIAFQGLKQQVAK
jgi:hypothetical protein